MAPVNKTSIDNAEFYSWGEGAGGWHFLNHPDLSVIRERIPPGVSEQLHYHNKARQFFMLLSGELTIFAGEAELNLEPGEGVHIPPGLSHLTINRGPEEAICLVISAPHSHTDRVNIEPKKYPHE